MKRILNGFFRFLASMNLAIFLLSAISVLIILQITSEKLIATFKAWKWLEAIATSDFYHSQGFILFLILFIINLLACCLKRLPETIKVLKNSLRELNESEIASLPFVERIKVKDFIKSSEKLSSLVATHFNKPTLIKKGSGQLNLYAEKGRFTPLGFYLAHLSILAIVLGVILSTSGYQYTFEMKKNQLLDPMIIRDSKGEKKALDFSLLCDNFKTIYYQGSSKVKKHQSILTILSDGKKIKTQAIDFGNSLNYGGISIHQDLNSRTIKYVMIKVVSKDGKSETYEVESGSWFKLKEIGISIIATQFEANSVLLSIASSPEMRIASSPSPEKICVSRSPVRFLDKRLMDYQFSLVEIFHQEATSLKIMKDRGNKLIWYATFCMLIGFGIIFFIPHRQLWLRVNQEEDGSVITLSGSTTKNLTSFEETFKDIFQNIKEAFCDYEKAELSNQKHRHHTNPLSKEI